MTNKLEEIDCRVKIIEDRQDFFEEVNATVLNELDTAVKGAMDYKMEEFIKKAADKADTNKDGKTTPIEWVMLLIKNPVFIVMGLLILTLREIPAFLNGGISTNVWEWSTLINSIVESGILFVWYVFTNSNNAQYTNVLTNVKAEYELKLHEKDLSLKDKDDRISEITDKYNAMVAKQGLLEYENEDLKKKAFKP